MDAQIQMALDDWRRLRAGLADIGDEVTALRVDTWEGVASEAFHRAVRYRAGAYATVVAAVDEIVRALERHAQAVA